MVTRSSRAVLSEDAKKGRSSALAQAVEDAVSSLFKGALVVEQVVVPVGLMDQRVELESKLSDVGALIELSDGLGESGLALDRFEPGARQFGYQVPDFPGPGIELDGAGHEEAAAAKNAATDVI
jgi:hypothetical protein